MTVARVARRSRRSNKTEHFLFNETSQGGKCMATFRRKAAEQEVKGIGQKVKGVAQEVAGRATGNRELRAKGEANQVAGHVRSRAGEAARKIGTAVNREKTRGRR